MQVDEKRVRQKGKENLYCETCRRKEFKTKEDLEKAMVKEKERKKERQKETKKGCKLCSLIGAIIEVVEAISLELSPQN